LANGGIKGITLEEVKKMGEKGGEFTLGNIEAPQGCEDISGGFFSLSPTCCLPGSTLHGGGETLRAGEGRGREYFKKRGGT